MTASAAEGSAKSAELAAMPLVLRTSAVVTVGCRASVLAGRTVAEMRRPSPGCRVAYDFGHISAA
jgi:hypothetical protein